MPETETSPGFWSNLATATIWPLHGLFTKGKSSFLASAQTLILTLAQLGSSFIEGIELRFKSRPHFRHDPFFVVGKRKLSVNLTSYIWSVREEGGAPLGSGRQWRPLSECDFGSHPYRLHVLNTWFLIPRPCHS